MAQSGSNTGGQRSRLPLKPWDQAGTSAGSAPFRPPSSGSTVDVMQASGNANAREIVPPAIGTVTNNSFGRPVPPRPWNGNDGRTYGVYGSTNHGNSTLYNPYGGYSGRLDNNIMHNRFGGPQGNSGMYRGGNYNGGYGGPMGCPYGAGLNNNQDPNNPFGPPPRNWVFLFRWMQSAVNCFGRLSLLLDRNAHAFHMFVSALLKFFDSSGLLYGELARFVLRILGIRVKAKQQQLPHERKNPASGPNVARDWDTIWAEGRK